jgi:hypothetical protein
MIPALVRLPATTLAPASIDDLVAVAVALGEDRTVVVPAQRDATGDVLDEFVVAASHAARAAGRLGVAARVGAGRAASVLAREATAAQLLGAADVVVLEGPPAQCRDAAAVMAALFTPGEATVTTPTASVQAARNLPLPDVDGGPPVCWRDGDDLVGLVDGSPSRLGTVAEVTVDELSTSTATLAVLRAQEGPPSALRDALAR